jgi:uncharacterized protein YutE (UPF0331/DUF86 family)
MTPAKLRAKTVLDRIGMARSMVDRIKDIPLTSLEEFTDDALNAAASESYLRRALEALMDLGRHILAKGFGRGVSEYKKVATELGDVGVLDAGEVALFRNMAGYRNRMVHLYHEVTTEELFRICSQQLGDFETITEAIMTWLRQNPEKLDIEI